MTVISLKAIVKDVLMQKGYSLHWYIQFLVYAKNCLRELTFDDLHVVNTKKIPVNEFNEFEIPADYQDYSRVNAICGEKLRPLVETDKLNKLPALDEDFNQTTYNASPVSETNTLFYGGLYPFYWNTTTWNEFGESTGRFFGVGASTQDDVFTVIKERNVIKVTETLDIDDVILEYISDGMDADSATRVDSYAIKTIDAYINWQHKKHNRHYGIGEVQYEEQQYIKERLILRARLSPLTMEVWKRLFQRASYASPKSA
jgi:hypothetical protein